MRGGDHDADAGLTLGDRRVADGHGKDALIEQAPAELLRQRRLAEHDRRDRGRAAAGIESEPLHGLLEVGGVVPQAVDQFGRLLEQVECRQASGRVRRGHGRGEQERPAALAQPVDNGRTAGDDPADDAERLRKRPDLDIDLAVQAEVIDDPAAAPAQHALTVGVVDHQQVVVLLGDGVDLIERRHIAVHAEHPVGDDHRPAIAAALVVFNHPAQVVGVAVRVAQDAGPGKPAAVDDAGMVELVRVDDVVLADQRRDGPQVGVESGLESDRRLDALELRHAALELEVQAQRAGDRANGGGPDAVLIDGALGGRGQPRVVGQAEVVVRAEVENAFAVHHKPGTLRRRQCADGVEQSGLSQAGDLVGDPLHARGGWHLGPQLGCGISRLAIKASLRGRASALRRRSRRMASVRLGWGSR